MNLPIIFIHNMKGSMKIKAMPLYYGPPSLHTHTHAHTSIFFCFSLLQEKTRKEILIISDVKVRDLELTP